MQNGAIKNIVGIHMCRSILHSISEGIISVTNVPIRKGNLVKASTVRSAKLSALLQSSNHTLVLKHMISSMYILL